MNLLALQDFNLVVTHGGFGRASRASGRPKATLSRRVRELEDELGIRLLERGKNSLQLTEAGMRLAAGADELLGAIDTLGSELGDAAQAPRGLLRISSPALFAQVAMGKLAAAFIAAYPEVRVEVTVEDRMVDLVEEHYDLVIRANPRPDETLVGRRLFGDALVVAAAPGVVRPADGATVPAVVMRSPAPRWTVLGDAPGEFVPEPVLHLSSMLMVRDATVADAGVALLSRAIIAPEVTAGKLVVWGPLAGGEVSLWILHTSRRYVASKVKAFVDFASAHFESVSFSDLNQRGSE